MTTMTADRTTIPVSDALLAQVLSPYREHCKYLKRALLEVHEKVPGGPIATLHGELAIGESCYIDDTGHFNSVEFNICFNQLAYVLLGQCVTSGLLPTMGITTIEEFRDRQLPHFLILRFQSAFKKAIDSERFTSRCTLKTCRGKRKLLLLDFDISFTDDQGGFAEGNVLVGVVDWNGPTVAP